MIKKRHRAQLAFSGGLDEKTLRIWSEPGGSETQQEVGIINYLSKEKWKCTNSVCEGT